MADPTSTRGVTSSDVARFAGVSTAVVSYVVNGGPRNVAPETADRVRRAIDLLGYSPNLSARALRRGQTQMLGLVLPDGKNPYFAELAHAVQDEAAHHGQVVVMANHGDSPDRQRTLVTDFARRGVDHVLVASPVGSIDDVRVAGVPTVLIDCPSPTVGAATIGPDSEGGSELAVRHLIEIHGHTSVAIALGETGEFGAENRERGWRRACRSLGLIEGPIERGPFTREGGYLIGQRLLALTDRPRAVFVSSDLQAFGFLRAVREAGLSVPEDLAMITFDDTIGARFSWPPLTAVRQPVQEMAAAAVSTVLAPGGPGADHQSFDMELVVRRSCGCDLPTDEV